MYDRATSESTEIITRNKSRACTLYGVYEERGDGAEGFLGVKNALLPKWSLTSLVVLLFHPDGLWLACTVSRYSTKHGIATSVTAVQQSRGKSVTYKTTKCGRFFTGTGRASEFTEPQLCLPHQPTATTHLCMRTFLTVCNSFCKADNEPCLVGLQVQGQPGLHKIWASLGWGKGYNSLLNAVAWAPSPDCAFVGYVFLQPRPHTAILNCLPTGQLPSGCQKMSTSPISRDCLPTSPLSVPFYGLAAVKVLFLLVQGIH